MTQTIASMRRTSVRRSAVAVATNTRLLLACGVAAGGLFIVANVIQILTRPGFDVTRHALSLLELGDLGWIQVATFLVTGTLALAYAAGMRRALHSGPAGTWGPVLVGVYGIGLIAAGLFHPDPALGFPPGAPVGMGDMSWHGALHTLAFLVLVLALVAACFIFARRFAANGERVWAYCVATGLAVPVLIVGGSANPTSDGVPLAMVGLVTAGWIAAVATNAVGA